MPWLYFQAFPSPGNMARWICVVLVLASCTGPGQAQESEPDQQFGHRYEGEAPDGRRTVDIAPEPETTTFSYYPAIFDSVVVRPAPFEAGVKEVPVEVLIKGAFPDGCLQLHAFEQERTGNIVTANLTMRRPQEVICASVRRPYRLYVMLNGLFTAGNYTMKLNGQPIVFQVHDPAP